MNLSGWAVLVSLVAGTIRALFLLRASSRVDAVNAVVLTTLAGGRGRELSDVLERSGSGLYLTVARSIGTPLEKLATDDREELRKRLERDAQLSLLSANRRVSRFVWLDAVSFAAILLAGASVFTGETPSFAATLGLVAATLLWLSNVYGARSLATRMFAGAMALVEGLVAGRDEILSANPREAGASESQDAGF